MNEWVITLLT